VRAEEGNGSGIFQCRMPHTTKFLIFGLRGRTSRKYARALVAARFELRLGENVLLEETLINVTNYIRMDKECSSNFVTDGYIKAPIMVYHTLHKARGRPEVYTKCFYSEGPDNVSNHKS
jgi:hypothetical protein